MVGTHLEFTVAYIAGLAALGYSIDKREREALMRVLKDRYQKTYGEIECEVAEFEMRDQRIGYATRPSYGIGPD